jgi:hypothetical protein
MTKDNTVLPLPDYTGPGTMFGIDVQTLNKRDLLKVIQFLANERNSEREELMRVQKLLNKDRHPFTYWK